MFSKPKHFNEPPRTSPSPTAAPAPAPSAAPHFLPIDEPEVVPPRQTRPASPAPSPAPSTPNPAPHRTTGAPTTRAPSTPSPTPRAASHRPPPGPGSVIIGADYWRAKEGLEELVAWDPERVSNHHIGVAGTSGAGKTHWIRQFVTALPPDVEIDIIDYHGDIEIPGAETVLFSETTRYGYNPLVLNTDEHYGGVRRGINDVIEAISSTSIKLGPKQESVLRNLLEDCYRERRIYAETPDSWHRRSATTAEIASIRENKDTASWFQTYPGLEDVVRIAKRKLKALWLGIDDKEDGRLALKSMDEYASTMRTLRKLVDSRGKLLNALDEEEVEGLKKKLDETRDLAIGHHANFLNRMKSGTEFEEAVKYHSKDTLLSVLTRVENLINVGIFSQNPPPFGSARIRRYNLRPLSQSADELKMFVRFRLRAIIREMMQKGDSGGRLRRMIVLDESKKFNDEESSNPINIIATEMRKFGLGLLMAGQSPTHFSEDFIKNSGTLLLLNLAKADWDDSARRLKIDVKSLQHLRPQETAAVQLTLKGEPPRFRQVQFLKA